MRRLRVLIAVTHLLGAGHLTRAAAFGRAFARAGHDVTLVSGGMPAALVAIDGFRFVQLPPVRIKGTDFQTLLDEAGQPVAPARLAERRAGLLAALAEARPDVVVTELFPFGRPPLAEEFVALLEAAEAMRPKPLVAASVRDILKRPSKPSRIEVAHARVERFYGAVLVHGDPGLVPLDASWPVDEAVRARLRYTGYVDDGAPLDRPDGPRGGEVVVSGGSSAASLALFEAALGAARLLPDRPWRLLVGGGVPVDDHARLTAAAGPNTRSCLKQTDFDRSARSIGLFFSRLQRIPGEYGDTSRVREIIFPCHRC